MKTQIFFPLLSLFLLFNLSAKAQDSLLYIVIRDAPDGGGREVDQVTMTADDALTLYAAGYNLSQNFIGDQVAKWSVTGDLDQMTDDSTNIFVFSPKTAPTSGTIIAVVGNISHHTETITVDVGAHCFFKLYVPCPHPFEILGQEKAICLPEIGDTLFANVGDYILVGGESYDCDENYRDENSAFLNLPISVDSTNFINTGTLTLEPTQILVSGGILFQFNNISQGRIILNSTDTSGVIIVQEPVDPAYIQIRSAPDGEGKEVEKWFRSEDGSIRLYCAGYGSSGNFISNIPVLWNVSLDYGNLIISPGEISDSLLVQNVGYALRIDNVLVYHSDLNLQDTTGVLYLIDNSLQSIQIRTVPDGQGDELTTVSMTTDDSLTLYTAGYDSSGYFLNNQIVEWYATGSLDILHTTDKALVFHPTTAPTSGTIIARVDDMSDATGTITVNPGELCSVEIRGGSCDIIVIFPSDSSENVCIPEYDDTTSAYVGDHLFLWAGGYDCEGNYIGDIAIQWDSISIEFTGTLFFETPSGTGNSFILELTQTGQGRVILNGSDTSGVIIITENPASIITNNSIPSQFKLEQAYPNPFNPSTTIRFYLPKSEHVLLEVYNNIGQKIETLIDQNMNAGEHTVHFNASHLSSGCIIIGL